MLDYIIFMDTLILGSQEEKIRLTFDLLDLRKESQVTKEDYQMFISEYLSMCEDMTECQVSLFNYEETIAHDFEKITGSRDNEIKINTQGVSFFDADDLFSAYIKYPNLLDWIIQPSTYFNQPQFQQQKEDLSSLI